ncbi:uncharacterized protein BO97DRAFT_376975 [Aspergillus homomorphus CBS 101889]|uniref:Mid2 domain-containing protein n=1 Tax=Aspergillus homomorphus (strain CBS 101889) TaxID=1450537 RepID=A0A395HKW4_ASPHC|nr:hypothetical protein BO97DRAFT_376975 [Aspergillus homomorphus CBS 101889]RAL08246.1 hypothetical protein BO97DRAFT_376975 [Aspergillus homomorphus CBS 101889]
MSSSVCHGMHNGIIQNVKADLPCGVTNATHPHVTCCVNGDYCLSNSICVNTHQNSGDYYYAADCTDETLADPVCGTRCGGRNNARITYTKEGYWACCEDASGTVDCSNPSEEKFPGPAPSQLATIQYLPFTASGTPTYAVASATSSPHSSTQPHTTSSTGIGAGAAAGIGVGSAAGVIAVAAVIAFMCFRRRKSSPDGVHGYHGISETVWRQQPSEMQAQQPIYELDRDVRHVELEAQPKAV